MSAPNSNRGINFGHSSMSMYDSCAYDDRLSQSVAPLMYNLNPNQIKNCNGCLSVFGPRASYNGYGVSSVMNNQNSDAPAQDLTDLESILTNRNVRASKCKNGKVQPIDVTKFKLNHVPMCNTFLDPIATHLTNPPDDYRGMSINRFIDLPVPAQSVIYFPEQINTSLEAKDNYEPKYRAPMVDRSLPQEIKGKQKHCRYPSYTLCSPNN